MKFYIINKGMVVFFLSLLSLSKANAKDGKIKAIACDDHVLCIAYDHYVKIVDVTDINHQKIRGTLEIGQHGKYGSVVCDIALAKNKMFVALREEGICVVDMKDLNKPVEDCFVEYNYNGSGEHVYNHQSIRVDQGLLSICSFYELGRKVYSFLDITNLQSPRYFDLYGGTTVPFPECDNLSHPELDAYAQLINLNDFHAGYYMDDNYADNNRVVICNVDSKHPEVLKLAIKDVQVENTDSFMTRACQKMAAVSLVNRLWIIDLENARVLHQIDFDFPIYLAGLNNKKVLIRNENSSDEYLIIDIKDSSNRIDWEHEDAKEYLMTDSLLMMRDEKDIGGFFSRRGEKVVKSLSVFDISDVSSITQIQIPFKSWGGDMRWIWQKDNILWGFHWDENKHLGSLHVADCTDLKNPKLRGVINGVTVGPKGFYIRDNKLYLLDAGRPNPVDNNWELYLGSPKVIDIRDLDKLVMHKIR